MSIRHWLARWLSPETFADQQAYFRIKNEASTAYRWLGGYPDAVDAIRWLLDNDLNYWRPLGVNAYGKLPSSICDFRNHLERRWGKPIAHLVWLQGLRAADDVEDYYEVARPGSKSVDGSDRFPVFSHPAPMPKVTTTSRLEQLLYRLLRDHPEIDFDAHIGQTRHGNAIYSLPELHAKAQKLCVELMPERTTSMADMAKFTINGEFTEEQLSEMKRLMSASTQGLMIDDAQAADMMAMRTAIADAIETLDLYADPAGYTDNNGEPLSAERVHPGLLAKDTASRLRAAIAATEVK